MKKTLGIIGGMGPMATADLYRKIVSLTDAANDREHIHTIIDSNTAIPDRTASIMGTGENALAELVASAIRLERAGAQLLAIPCNTAHYYYEGICARTSLPVLHMPRLTAEYAAQRGYKTLALLATDGTVRAGVYAKPFEEAGLELILPDGTGQKRVMSLIYDGVKAGKSDFDVAPIKETLDALVGSGAEAFVLGCTELPIAFADYALDYPLVDPTLILARAAIEAAGYAVKAD